MMNQKTVFSVLLLSALQTTSALAIENQYKPAFESHLQSSEEKALFAPENELFHSLTGHIPHSVKNMSDKGKANESEVLSVTVALKLNNEEELNQRVEDMYRPGSPTFHQFLQSGEFAEKYAPTSEQLANEKAFLEANGIQVESTTENHAFINASGSISAINHAFKTEIHKYVHPSGKEYFAPAFELQTPVASRITAVIGLNNTGEVHSHLIRHTSNSNKKNPTATPTPAPPPPEEGSAPGQFAGLAPADIRTAYNIPSNLDGSGQTLALVELDGYNAANIAAYEKQFNLPNTPLKNVLIGGFSGKPSTSANSGEVEVELDIEMMVAVAPKATQIIVYEGSINAKSIGTSFVNVYSKIASDNSANVISSSWGMPEDGVDSGTLQSENTIFKQMVAQGQTFFVAAGDQGAEDDQSHAKVAVVDDPSGQPYVVAVGGTKLVIDSHANWASETTWNELNANPNLSEGAGGGGVSTKWSIPSWQTAAIGGDSQASKTMRNVPDVALNADPETGYGIFVTAIDPETKKAGTGWIPMGGTSAASPLWAAFASLVNQNRAAKGLSPTGFLNPAIYAAGTSANASADFHDINDGSNNGDKNANFKTFKGYDNATGFGSFQASNLLNDLSQ